MNGIIPLQFEEGTAKLARRRDEANKRQDEVAGLREAGLTYVEIGQRLGVTRQRAEQIHKGNPTLRTDAYTRSLLITSDLARLLSVHPSTVRGWSDRGILKAHRIGPRGERRFLPEDIDAFLKNAGKQRHRPDSQQAMETWPDK